MNTWRKNKLKNEFLNKEGGDGTDFFFKGTPNDFCVKCFWK